MKVKVQIRQDANGYLLWYKKGGIFSSWSRASRYNTLQEAKDAIPWAVAMAHGSKLVYEWETPDD